MPARGCDLHRAAREDLSAHVREVSGMSRLAVGRRRRLARQVGAAQPRRGLPEIAHRMHRERLDERGLGCGLRRAQQGGHAVADECIGQRQRAAHAAYGTVE